MSNRTLAGRVLCGVWAVNFLLLTTETFTYSGQGKVSLGLAVAAMALLFQR